MKLCLIFKNFFSKLKFKEQSSGMFPSANPKILQTHIFIIFFFYKMPIFLHELFLNELQNSVADRTSSGTVWKILCANL